jgi:hypothetical protein
MMIAPTSLTAYQFIFTEPELRAAIANPASLLPHFKAALNVNRPAPTVDPAATEPKADSTPASEKPNLRTATIRIPLDEWLAFCAEFARLYPHFQNGEGQPDKFHISLTALRCGFPEITPENFSQVVSALITHAQEQHPAPV